MLGLPASVLSCVYLQFEPNEQNPFCLYILHSLTPGQEQMAVSPSHLKSTYTSKQEHGIFYLRAFLILDSNYIKLFIIPLVND